MPQSSGEKVINLLYTSQPQTTVIAIQFVDFPHSRHYNALGTHNGLRFVENAMAALNRW